MKKNILSFGYLPRGKGGKQETGLATAIFSLDDAINSLGSEFKITIAATDIHDEFLKVGHTEVLGWTKWILLKHLMLNPFRTLHFFSKTFNLYKFRLILPLRNIFFKFLFLDYAIKKVNPEVLHFDGSLGALISTGLYKKDQIKILRIHGINGFDSSVPNFSLHLELEKFITNLPFDTVTFVTNSIRNEWKINYGNFNCPIKTVLNGYNELLFNPIVSYIPRSIQFDLITFSGISERKGQERVLKALKKLKSENIILSYLILGSGNKSYIDSLKRFCVTNELAVTFIDYLPQEELVNYLRKSRYFILPSFTEGFGQVFLESIGSGIPVIIPQHLPLAKEMGILNKNNSYFILDSNVESIVDGLKSIFLNKLEYDEIKVSSSISSLTWNNIAMDYIKIFKVLLNN